MVFVIFYFKRGKGDLLKVICYFFQVSNAISIFVAIVVVAVFVVNLALALALADINSKDDNRRR